MLPLYLACACAWGLLPAAALLPPSQDPWYAQPANISAYAPGELIRARAVAPELETYVPLGTPMSVALMHQYLYRTTDSVGAPVAAAATLIVPHHADPTKLLAYETFYDANNPDCSPSYTLRRGSASGGLLPRMTQPMDLAFLAAALNQGWWIITADYEGLAAQFAAGVLAGQATLDSVRVALREAPQLGLSRAARYALWGYSGGALAAEWAVELQPTYAPELAFAGAALGGLLPDLTAALDAINAGPFSGAAFVILIGLAKAYPAFGEWVARNLVAASAAEFYAGAESCVLGEFAAGAVSDVFRFFVRGRASFAEEVPAGVLRSAGRMGRRGAPPRVPLYVYKGAADEISPIGDTDELVAGYCAEGEGEVTIEYQRILAAEHLSTAVLGAAGALQWLAERLEGRRPLDQPGGCTTRTVLLGELKPGALAFWESEVGGTLASVLGGEL